jgi:phosphoribosylformimino-5-aminoimidazole carboxamide ribotide isomerase
VEVIPAIDLLDGRCVRLLRGDFGKATEYSDDPAAVATQFVKDGARRIHVVDLDAARDESSNRAIVEAIVSQTGADVEVAGGVRSQADARRWLDAGAAYVVIGTMAAETPEAAIELITDAPGRVCVALDMRGNTVSTHGWEKGSGESLEELLEVLETSPLESYIYTDIGRDGTMLGPNFDALAHLIESTKHRVTLSGGVSSMDDVRRANSMDAAAVILGRALYEGRLSLKEALAAAG